MQYDDVGCSSMFQLTHSASSINSDASDRSSKSGTVRPLTSLQPLNPSTCSSSKVKKKKIILQKASKQWLHLQRKSPTNRFLFLFCFQLFSPLFSSGRATRPGGTSQEGRCSSLPPTRQRTGVKIAIFIGPMCLYMGSDLWVLVSLKVTE